MTGKALKFGPLGPDTVHVCVDMQRLFGEETQWHTRDLAAILKNTARIVAHAPASTILTRFRTPNTADEAPGQWRNYYQRWDRVLASQLPEEMFGVMPDLAGFAPPAVEIDKTTYNAFESPTFQQAIDRLKPGALIFSGVETDVCVLATLLAAVDRGYRSIVARDAVASGNAIGHRAALEMVIVRYEMQIEIADTDDILAQWQPAAKR
ncbi:MAG: cysteine hydrolase [Dongiaceae bacterium]